MATEAVAKVVIDIERLTNAALAYREALAGHNAAVTALDAAKKAETYAQRALAAAEADLNDVFDSIMSGGAGD